MGVTRTSRRTTATAILTMLQIQALISVKTKAKTAVEGQDFYFSCKYKDGQGVNTKYFSHDESSTPLILTDKHDQWVSIGRFSLYDNTSGSFFMVRMSNLKLEDSGKYWCGVDVPSNADKLNEIQLNVTRGPSVTTHPPDHSPYDNIVTQNDLTASNYHILLYLNPVMCVVAIVTVCLFTLLLTMIQRRPAPHTNREVSSDYVTMMPGVNPYPELSCMDADCAQLSDSRPTPPDLSSYLSLKQRESTVTFSNNEYADVGVSRHIGTYQHLDLSRVAREHVYHSLHGSSGPVGVKEQCKC